MEHNEGFQFTYSPAQRQEVENIRKKYLPREADKMEQLRALHRIPTQKAQAGAVVLGVVGTLILGTGMSLFMSELGQILGMNTELSMAVGIAAGLVGLALTALAYPVYNHLLSKERERIAPEILRLSEELLQQ